MRLLRARHVDLDQLRADLRNLSGPPFDSNTVLAIETLNRTLDRMLSAKERLDSKAAAVPAVVGAVAAFVAPRIELTLAFSNVQILLAGASVAGASLAVGLSLAALTASEHAVGPAPGDLVKQSPDPPDKYIVRVATSLALAVTATAEVVHTKGVRFNLSIASAATSIVSMVALAVIGAFH